MDLGFNSFHWNYSLSVYFNLIGSLTPLDAGELPGKWAWLMLTVSMSSHCLFLWYSTKEMWQQTRIYRKKQCLVMLLAAIPISSYRRANHGRKLIECWIVFCFALIFWGTSSPKRTSMTVCNYSHQFMPQFEHKIHKLKMDQQFNCMLCWNNQKRKKTAMNHITEGTLPASAIQWPP